MLKRIIASAGAVAAAAAWMGSGPAEALPACVAGTAIPSCSVDTSGYVVEMLGRAEGGSVRVYGRAGNLLGSYYWTMGLATPSVTSEAFSSEPGGYAVLTVDGVGAVTLTST